MSGFNTSINASLSSMNESSKTTSIVSSNIANVETSAFKRVEQYFQAIVNSQSGEKGGVTSTLRQLIDDQGESQTTGISTDLEIEGNGFAIVTDQFINGKPHNIFVTRDLSFRKDETNMLVNPSGYYLLCWDVDANGNLPTTKSLLTSLVGVNVSQGTAQATSTTNVEFGANLVSQQTVIGQGATTINISNQGIKKSPTNAYLTSSEILYPNSNNSLTAGEGLEITIGSSDSSSGTSTKKILYGGFAQTFTFANSGTDLSIAASGNAATDSITIQYGNQTISVSRGNGITNRDVLQYIADQINLNSGANGVQAQLYDLGATTSISIAPTTINQALTFSGSLAFRNQIGLDDSKNVAAFAPDIEGITVGRFATLNQLASVLTGIGITASVNDDEALGSCITIKSQQPVAFNNYQPLGKGSDFLTELGLDQGYLKSLYDPYLSNQNMAGGAYNSHFSQNVTIYDSMGNEHNLLISFIKTGVNQWGVEIFSIDPLAVNIPGRTDGLLMAGTFKFDGAGNFLSIDPVPQYSYSKAVTTPNKPLGATNGQTFVINISNTIYTFNYGSMIASSNGFAANGIDLSTATPGNAATDTLIITAGNATYNIVRGNGATNLAVLKNIAEQINQTTGSDSISAKVIYDSNSLQYKLDIRANDSTLAVTFGQAGNIGTNLGITSANNIAANSFQTLYELADQINTTQGPTATKALVVPGTISGTYNLRMAPVNTNLYLSFSGTTSPIGNPLGTGASQTIASALGLNNTTAASQLVSPDKPLTINWSNIIGSNPNIMNFSWGTFGYSNGMSQVSGNYSIKQADQNGVSTGDLTGISIDSNGWITASYSNSLTRQIYKIPIGVFANPNGLVALPGNTFRISKDSGPLNLKEAGLNGAGTFVSGALEGSNVDLAAELAKLIFAQRQYQASAKIINIVDKLLDDLVHRTFN